MIESGEGIVALDQKGKVHQVNATAESILGWNADEIIGKDFFALTQLLLPEDVTPGAGSQCPAINTVKCPHLNVCARLTRKDQSEIAINFMLTSVFDDKSVVGKVFIFKEENSDKALSDSLELMDAAASIIVRLDAQGNVTFSNQHGQWLFGNVNHNTFLPITIKTLLLEAPNQLDQQTIMDRRWVEGQRKEACIAWSVAVTRNSLGDVTGAVCIGNDLTDHHHALKGKLQERLMAQQVFEHINDGVITVDREGLVEYLNPTAEHLTGWSCEEARGQMLKDVYHVVDEHTLEGMDDPVSRYMRDRGNADAQGNRVLLRRGGWEFIIQDFATPIHDAEGDIAGAVVVLNDVSELRGMERWMEYEASHDSLTGLLNRRQFETRLREALESVHNTEKQHALFYMDLDQFKLINDGYGHTAGDQLLKEISALLQINLTDEDSLARLGGDEFGVILENSSMENARAVSNRLCRAVRDYRFLWDGKPFEIGVSIGLVPITAQWEDIADIMRVADSACYVAKEKGRNRVHVYTIRDLALRQRDGEIQWIQRIRHALKEGRFRLYCQNIVPLGEELEKTPHYEVLLRMIDDDGGIIRPAAFIAAAERYHLMPDVDRWVVESTLKLLGERHARGEHNGIFSINISGQSLDDESFMGFVVDQIDNSEVPPESICFEITETAAASSLDVVKRFMSILSGMGCKFALDDFGRGISSFAYLKSLEVDYLKIDGMFVKDLAVDKVGHAMVESINHIGHIMGVETIAEFVESKEVLERLMDLGVDHVQGYQLGRPRPMISVNLTGNSVH
ncbi:EAL domain-containing protein [Kaarinaea lacus]